MGNSPHEILHRNRDSLSPPIYDCFGRTEPLEKFPHTSSLDNFAGGCDNFTQGDGDNNGCATEAKHTAEHLKFCIRVPSQATKKQKRLNVENRRKKADGGGGGGSGGVENEKKNRKIKQKY